MIMAVAEKIAKMPDPLAAVLWPYRMDLPKRGRLGQVFLTWAVKN